MRHRKSGRKLNRNSPHRKAMFSNMVTSLIDHERIETTNVKAKELRSYIDKVVTRAGSVSDLISKGRDKQTDNEKAKIVHAIRMAKRIVKDADMLQKLFNDIGPRYQDRSGGYTRIIKKGPRRGDAASMALIEFVDMSDNKSKSKQVNS